VRRPEMAAQEMGRLSLADALLLCELLAGVDPQRYERAALRWLKRFIDEPLPPLTEVALAASALAELRHGQRSAGVETLKRLVRQSLVTGGVRWPRRKRHQGHSECPVTSRFARPSVAISLPRASARHAWLRSRANKNPLFPAGL
jgi:hypothetical protein